MIPLGECEDFRTTNGRHLIKGSRRSERRHSICFASAIDMGTPEPLPGSTRGKCYFLKLAHPGNRDAWDCIWTELYLLQQDVVRSCRSVAEVVPGGEGQWNGVPFIVKRYIEGLTLQDALADRIEIPVQRVGELLYDMAIAADACHQVGYCVCDWSTSNVNYEERMLLDLSGSVRFGEPVRYARLESPDLGGTASPRVDVRGICMLALDIFCSDAIRRLSHGEIPYQQMLRDLRGTRPDRCPECLWRVIYSGLAEDATATITTPKELSAALVQACGGPQVASPRPVRRGVFAKLVGRLTGQ